MKALVGTFNQEKALVGAFSVIVRCPLYLWRLPSWAMLLWAAHCSARRELLAPASHALEHTLWLAVQYSTVQHALEHTLVSRLPRASADRELNMYGFCRISQTGILHIPDNILEFYSLFSLTASCMCPIIVLLS